MNRRSSEVDLDVVLWDRAEVHYQNHVNGVEQLVWPLEAMGERAGRFLAMLRARWEQSLPFDEVGFEYCDLYQSLCCDADLCDADAC